MSSAPVCSKYHEPKGGQDEAAKKAEPASHGCLVVYISHQCPICLGKTMCNAADCYTILVATRKRTFLSFYFGNDDRWIVPYTRALIPLLLLDNR